MQSILATLALAAVMSIAPAVTFAGGDHSHHAHGAQAAANPSLADGTVKKVDKAAGRITVAHGPLPNGMPAMTMAFVVKNPVWLNEVKDGDRIRFAAENVDGKMMLVRVEAAR